MPGNELDQVMTGVDYGGTMVTGLLFSQEAGWDKAGWYDFPWDNYGNSRIKAFRADGSTAAYTFDTAPATTGSPNRTVSGGFTYYTWTQSGSITI